jgi:holo-[acyl-carrier protein] synthase
VISAGSGLVDIRRIAATLERHGERFVARVFTSVGRAKCEGRAARAAGHTRRFVAKEACAKALGTGLRRGVLWQHMGVVDLPGGRPTMVLTGGASRRWCRKAFPPLGCRPRGGSTAWISR